MSARRRSHSIVTAIALVATTLAMLGPARLPTARLVTLTAFTARAEPAAATASTLVHRRANWKKGVGTWAFPGSRSALRKSGVSWYYTWSVSHSGISTPRGVAFVPMIWGPRNVTTKQLRAAQHEGHVLLGFNEPDLASQSNMSVGRALQLWPRLMKTGMRLGSPAVAGGGATPGGWLDSFMSGAAARHYRVSFITLHWYGRDFATQTAASELQSYLQAVWARYHKPIWLTEFALWRFNPSVFPTPQQQAAFVTAATAMLERLSYVWRYAWFALPADSQDGTTGLFLPGAVPTVAGRAFERVDSRR